VIATETARSFEALSARKPALSRPVRGLVSIVSCATLVLPFSLGTMGCSNAFPFKKSQQPATQRELPKAQTAPLDRPVSDRQRDDAARGVRGQPEPAAAPTQPAAAPAQPSAAPAQVAPVQNGGEPDPRAVIDWLLKDRR